MSELGDPESRWTIKLVYESCDQPGFEKLGDSALTIEHKAAYREGSGTVGPQTMIAMDMGEILKAIEGHCVGGSSLSDLDFAFREGYTMNDPDEGERQ